MERQHFLSTWSLTEAAYEEKGRNRRERTSKKINQQRKKSHKYNHLYGIDQHNAKKKKKKGRSTEQKNTQALNMKEVEKPNFYLD